ncbi:MAG: hypothetical protein CMI96_04580 [Pelagibacteraceae bacterium]|nr:hypothetical protein [Pelagibacteraceae bacterium]|tara:strand:- start:705 stop:1154 length:450 start_codon:yes stop_codon:yes gene_type:complete
MIIEMKKLLIFILFSFFLSPSIYSLEISKPLWEQMNFLSCVQLSSISCFDKECKFDLKKNQIPMTIDFKANELIFPLIERKHKIINKNLRDMISHFENVIITKDEMITIEHNQDNNNNATNLNFVRISSSFPFGVSHVFIGSGICTTSK